jgi:methylthioribose-1-phosphate isomerase
MGTADEDPIPRTIEWCGDRIRLIDQRRLPHELVLVDATTVDELCDYIKVLAVRGAPALGAAGAMGVALAHVTGVPVDTAAAQIVATRPTAVNLAWGVQRALDADDPAAEAERIADDDVVINRALGAAGAEVVAANANVLTHCNAGALACVGYGTALGVIRAAHEQGKRPHVWVDETRPLLQGARLTAWELDRLGIDCTLVIDSMATSLMSAGQVDVVVVGADRVAANGDTANKVGTHGVAVLAHHFGVPFYVAMPLSTVDPDTADGAAIVVEQRDADEVASVGGHAVAAPGVAVDNRAFDVTPAGLVAGWITEAGLFRDPAELLVARRSVTRSR